jgi:endonuclease/exonuclease/phosphatase family metal-dependent hydrolase
VWPLRRDLLVSVIRDAHPDVLGLQEALRFQLDEIGAALATYREVGVGRDDGIEAGEYSAILFDSTRVALEDSGTFWLSDTPEEPGSTSWGNRITRICTWARLRERDTGAVFYHFNTHWDHQSQPSRERSARLILERIAARGQPGTPVLLTGDFNAGESNPAFRTLVEDTVVSLRDTFRALHPDATGVGTFNGFEGDSDGDKIDAILASPEWRVLDAEIARVNDRGRYPSDHYPVTASLRLASERASGGAAR